MLHRTKMGKDYKLTNYWPFIATMTCKSTTETSLFASTISWAEDIQLYNCKRQVIWGKFRFLLTVYFKNGSQLFSETESIEPRLYTTSILMTEDCHHVGEKPIDEQNNDECFTKKEELLLVVRPFEKRIVEALSRFPLHSLWSKSVA